MGCKAKRREAFLHQIKLHYVCASYDPEVSFLFTKCMPLMDPLTVASIPHDPVGYCMFMQLYIYIKILIYKKIRLLKSFFLGERFFLC